MKSPIFLFLALAMCCPIASAAPKLEEVGKLEMPGDTALTNTLVFSADGKTLYGADLTKPVIWIWDIATGKRRELIRFPGGDIWDIDLSPDGKELGVAVDYEDDVWTDLVRIELPSGEVTGSIRAKEKIVSSLRYHPGGTVFATENEDIGGSGLRFWKRSDWPKTKAVDHSKVKGIDARMKTGAGEDYVVSFLEFTPDKKRVVTANAEAVVRVWTLPRCTSFAELTAPKSGAFFTIDASATDGGRVVACGPASMAVWDIASKKSLGVQRNGAGKGKWAVGIAQITPDGKRIVSTFSRNKSGEEEGIDAERPGLLIWDVPLGDGPVFELKKAHDGYPVHTLAMSPDGKTVVSGMAGEMKVWKITE